MRLKISLFYLILYLGMGSFRPFTSLLLQERNFSGFEIGTILAVGSLAGIASQPVFGIITDASKDYRTLLKVSLLLSAFFVLGFFFIKGFALTIIIMIIYSLINSPLGAVTDSLAVKNGPAYGYSFGQVRLFGSTGFAFMTVTSGYIFGAIGYQYTALVYSAFIMLLFLLVFTFPESEKPEVPMASGWKYLFAVLGNWKFDLLIAICLLIAANNTMNYSYLPIFFKKLDYPVSLVGWTYTIAALVEIPLFWLSSKFIRRIGLFPMMIAGTCLYGVKYVIIGFAPPVAWLLFLQILDGIAYVFYFSSVVEIINRIAPRFAKTTAQTVFAATGGIAGIAANLAGGLIVDHQGPQFLFWMMGGIAVLAVALLLLFPGKNELSENTAN